MPVITIYYFFVCVISK